MPMFMLEDLESNQLYNTGLCELSLGEAVCKNIKVNIRASLPFLYLHTPFLPLCIVPLICPKAELSMAVVVALNLPE